MIEVRMSRHVAFGHAWSFIDNWQWLFTLFPLKYLVKPCMHVYGGAWRDSYRTGMDTFRLCVMTLVLHFLYLCTTISCIIVTISWKPLFEDICSKFTLINNKEAAKSSEHYKGQGTNTACLSRQNWSLYSLLLLIYKRLFICWNKRRPW